MKTLVFKEWRENVNLAALGLLIYTLLLVILWRGYVEEATRLMQPLADSDLVSSTGWFCGIFGAVLGWLQIHNERRPDLWAFLLHRPLTRTQIFLGKTLAGLGLYAVAVGAPLLSYIMWVRWPGHVAAPFEPTMLRPVMAYVLIGIVFYFAGMLTGLRQARWYVSRALGLGMGLLVSVLVMVWPEFWQGLLVIVIGGGLLATAAWGGFQSHGYYRGQPLAGRAALTFALIPATAFAVLVAVVTLGNFLSKAKEPPPWSEYAVTKDGAILKVTRAKGQAMEIVDLEGKPFLDPKTGRMPERSDFRRHCAKLGGVELRREDVKDVPLWLGRDLLSAAGWRATADTLWYYWRPLGRLVGYDIATRRCIGSLGPEGFARDLTGRGDRFSRPNGGGESRTLHTATTVYRLDLEKRATVPLFTTTSDDPILATSETTFNDHDWEYMMVLTKRFLHLLTPEGQAVWKVAYEPKGPAYNEFDIYFLESPGQFVLWRAPSYEASVQANWKLPVYVSRIARDQGVVKSIELPTLPNDEPGPEPMQKVLAAVMPPAVMMTLPHLYVSWWSRVLPRELLPLSLAVAAVLCVPIGWWLGRRYRFTLGAQVGWAVFYVLFGVPGLLAFLCVQEWPARVPCPNCKRQRLVGGAQCEHCGADFAPPERTGTEVFVPLGAKVEVAGQG